MSASAPRVLLLGFGAIGRQLVTLFDPSEFEDYDFCAILNADGYISRLNKSLALS